MTDLRKAVQQATPRADLLAELMDSNEPKTEREHAAVYEIERLRAALAQPDVPQGWVLVPVEPTHEMCDQGAQAIVQWENGCVWPDSWGNTYVKQYRKDAKKAYSAMLAAAPKGGAR